MIALLRGMVVLAVVAAGAGFAPLVAADFHIRLDPPGPRDFILDKANKLDAATRESLRKTCDKLLTDKAIPIVIVTINSMGEHASAELRVETFARLLFDQWQIGVAKLGKRDWNTGILVLVSVADRKARIELGAGWGREQDQACQAIMDQRMVPRFRQGDFAGGITAGVEALDAMARGKTLPPIPRPWWHYALVAGAVGLAVFTIVSMIRRGSSGWAWLAWAAVFSLIGYLLYQLLTNWGNSNSDGGFGGGSFGGGFSGGGGATGSW